MRGVKLEAWARDAIEKQLCFEYDEQPFLPMRSQFIHSTFSEERPFLLCICSVIEQENNEKVLRIELEMSHHPPTNRAVCWYGP